MSAQSLMVLGTASHVGKSLMVAGLGRIFSDLGYRVAPFKAQNMSLNSAATPEGLEIGRAQALQAEACRIAACVEMNPVLLKPACDTASQVVLLGRIWGEWGASEYHQLRVEELFPTVLESYHKLAGQYDLILLEGAGSPAEINLKDHDIVNLRMAEAAGATCLLVGDIDRGGVFASLLGTLQLLESAERERIAGFVINKFRGDVSLLEPGVRTIEQRISKPCLGVVPFLHNLALDEEDGVAAEDRRRATASWRQHSGSEDASPSRRLLVGVVALPHLANFTDFDALAAEPSLALAYLERAADVEAADIVILPGSKQAVEDLDWLRQTGVASAILERRQSRKRLGVIGICGGMQMLGMRIEDPFGIESGGRSSVGQGLGLLPISTVLSRQKVTRRIRGTIKAPLFGEPLGCLALTGYEIHVGETEYQAKTRPFAELIREGSSEPIADGAVSNGGWVWGTYVHGAFDDDVFRHALIKRAREAFQLTPPAQLAAVSAEREQRLDRWADHLRKALDVGRIQRLLAECGRG
ncbi:MAG: cobyric acid synthase [Acidobacteriota bacterium]